MDDWKNTHFLLVHNKATVSLSWVVRTRPEQPHNTKGYRKCAQINLTIVCGLQCWNGMGEKRKRKGEGDDSTGEINCSFIISVAFPIIETEQGMLQLFVQRILEWVGWKGP